MIIQRCSKQIKVSQELTVFVQITCLSEPPHTYLPYPLDLLRFSKKHDQPTNRPFSYKTPWEGRFGGHHLPTKSRRSVDPPAISGLQRSDTKGFIWVILKILGKGIARYFWVTCLFLCHPIWKISQLRIAFVSSKVSFLIYHLLNRGEPQPTKKAMWIKAPYDFVPPELMVEPPGVQDYNHHQLALSWDTIQGGNFEKSSGKGQPLSFICKIQGLGMERKRLDIF